MALRPPDKKPRKSLSAIEKEERDRLAARQARTDMTITAEDRRPIPLRLNDPLRPMDLSEAFLTYLTGQSARTGRHQRLHRILRELEAADLRVADMSVFTVLATHYRFRGATQRDTAGALVTSQATVSRALTVGHAWVEERWNALVQEES